VDRKGVELMIFYGWLTVFLFSVLVGLVIQMVVEG